jgi:hypothetical protein
VLLHLVFMLVFGGDMAFTHATRKHVTVSPSLAAAHRDERQAEHELAAALPRTSRFRSHDDDVEELSGCLGTTSRYAAFDTESSEERA